MYIRLPFVYTGRMYMCVRWLALCLFIKTICFVRKGEACQYYLGEEGEEGAEADYYNSVRRKRSTESEREEQTEELREYFTACMETLLPSSEYGWRSNVDFTVLDTMWYLNTEQTYCSPSGSGATKECWQEEITNYIEESSDGVLETAQTCIDHYAEDSYAEPPTNRYEQSRKKRSSEEREENTQQEKDQSEEAEESSEVESLGISRFDRCLRSRMTDNSMERQDLNFTTLSLFVEMNTMDGCDKRKGNRTRQGPRFASNFVALTRPDSSLRDKLSECQKQEFPPDDFWGSWGAYSRCSTTCGVGTRTRRRGCRSGVDPKMKSDNCSGRARERKTCNLADCDRTGSLEETGKNVIRTIQMTTMSTNLQVEVRTDSATTISSNNNRRRNQNSNRRSFSSRKSSSRRGRR